MWLLQKQLDSLKSLSEIIEKTPRISLDLAKRQKIKTQLMDSIKLAQAIPVVSSQIKPEISFRVFLKEKLLTIIEFESRKKFFVLPKFTPMRLRFLGAVLTLAVFIIGFFNFAFTPYKASAAAATTLDEIIGSVVIIRDSQAMTVKPGFVLKIDDVIKTGKDSQAVIKFLDQSVSRLSENTEVQISKLFINPLNKTETLVEIVLNRGRLWNRVVNLIDDFSHFQVKAGDTLAVAKKKAAFDVEMASKKKAKVSAIQNHVDVTVEIDEKIIETTVVKGFSAEVKTNSKTFEIVRDKADMGEGEGWIADNLEKDRQYIETVKKESQEQRMQPQQGLPQAISLMPIIEEDEQKQNFVEARKKFSDAELLFNKGFPDKAVEALNDFYARMESILKWLQWYEVSNPSEAFVLKMQIVETLNNYKKQLALILPTEVLYPLKETVSRTQLLFASADLASATQQKLSDAEDKLIEAHDLAEIGEMEAAKEQVEAYTQTISDVVFEIKQMPKFEKEQAVNVLLEKPLEGLKTLETIQESPPVQPDQPLVTDSIGESVSVAKTEALSKIGEAVVEAQKLNTEKPEDIKNKTIDINGKSVDVQVTQQTVTVKTGDEKVTIDKTRPVAPERGEEAGSSSVAMPESGLKSSVLPQARP